MIINHASEPQLIEDFEFITNSGDSFTESINVALGDTVDWDTSPLAVIFHYAAKPSPLDPDLKMPAEKVSIFLNHIVRVKQSTRLVMPASPEQKDCFRQTLLKTSATIQ
jgi:hypothetical protein